MSERLNDFMDDTVEFVGGIIEGLREVSKNVRRIYWEKVADIKRQHLQVPSSVDLSDFSSTLNPTGLQYIVSEIDKANPDFLRIMKETQEQHATYGENRTTIGIISLRPRGHRDYIVLAMYNDAQGDHFVGFVPNLSCNTFALRDATGNEKGDNYYVYHTTPFYGALALRAETFNSQLVKRAETELTRRGTNFQNIDLEEFNYDLGSMSPINYLALSVNGVIAGENSVSLG